MTNIEAVRLKSSDKSTITREVAKGNAVDRHFKLKNDNLLTSIPIEVRVNDALKVVGVDYTVDYVNGIVDFPTAPIVNAALEFVYFWSIFSDTEIQFFLTESGENTTVATSYLLLAWAADAARLAKRQTLSGGGGLGQVVIDTSVVAKELRATAKALIDTQQDLGESIPAEGLTEIPWTEAGYRDQVGQHFTREN